MSCHNLMYGAEFSREEIRENAEKGGLLSMEIEFNRDCNFNCQYCYVQNDGNGRQELSRDESREVISQAKEMGARKIIVLGGEPMLYPHIMEMLRYIKESGMEVELFTNGTNMTPAAATELAGLGVVVVLKMNTRDEKLQDLLSGKKGAYSTIQEALANLKSSGYPDRAPLGIGSVICSQNIDQLPGMWKWMRDEKITPYMETITPQGNAKDNDSLDIGPDRIRDLFYEIADIDAESYGIQWKPQPPLIGGQCLRHQFSCAVNAYGDVLPCIGVTLPLGNIRERKLADIINDSEVVEDLRHYEEKIKGPCARCEMKSDCYGCRGAAYQITGDYLASDPLCWKNTGKMDEISSLPFDASRLVPHKPPMLVVDSLTEIGERSASAELEIGKDSILVEDNGTISDVFYIEMIAQSVAALNGYKNMQNGSSSIEGFLLGIKNLEVLGSSSPGDRLRVNTQEVVKLDEFAIIEGEIFRGDEIVARGEIKVWHDNKAHEAH